MSEHERGFRARDEAERVAADLAAARGHTLGRWQRISDRVFATICTRCEALAFVERSAGVGRALWYVEGAALEEPCPGEG